MQLQTVLQFWFTKLTPQQHFAKDAALDESIRTASAPRWTPLPAVNCSPTARYARGAGWQKSWCWTSSRATWYRDAARALRQDALALP